MYEQKLNESNLFRHFIVPRHMITNVLFFGNNIIKMFSKRAIFTAINYVLHIYLSTLTLYGWEEEYTTINLVRMTTRYQHQWEGQCLCA